MLRDESKEFCKRQAARMSCLSRWPFELEGQTELAKALHAAAESEAHVGLIVDWILGNSSVCPTPREIRGIAFDLRAKQSNPSIGCQRGCGGSGFIQTQKVLPGGHVYTGVRPCGCRASVKRPEDDVSDDEQPAQARTDMVRAADIGKVL